MRKYLQWWLDKIQAIQMKLLFCLAVVLGGGLMGCVSTPSPQATAVARVKPFVAALDAYHRDTGDYPQKLNDLYPRYLAENVPWHHNEDRKQTWVLGYERVGRGDYELYLDSSPCSQAIFENGRLVAGYGPNYQ